MRTIRCTILCVLPFETLLDMLPRSSLLRVILTLILRIVYSPTKLRYSVFYFHKLRFQRSCSHPEDYKALEIQEVNVLKFDALHHSVEHLDIKYELSICPRR